MTDLSLQLQQHVQWVKTGGRSGQPADLSKADLRRADLSRADLRGADLNGANLREANLHGANLSEGNWINTDMRGADLRGANLIEANLRGADLRGADLRGSRLCEGSLPTPQQLLADLWDHAQTEEYDQASWCGTNCCLAGAAGRWGNNQTLGVAVIAMVLPFFDLSVLYQTGRNEAIAELERCLALLPELNRFNVHQGDRAGGNYIVSLKRKSSLGSVTVPQAQEQTVRLGS